MSIQTLLNHQNIEAPISAVEPFNGDADASLYPKNVYSDAVSTNMNYSAIDVDGYDFTDFEEDVLKKVMAEKIRPEMFLTLLSYLARIPKSAKAAILSHQTIRDYFLIVDPDLENILPTVKSLIKRGGTAQRVYELQQDWFAHLQSTMFHFWENEDIRNISSWRAEIAAVIVATYPDYTKIPQRIKKQLQATFGNDVLASDEFREIRKGITTKTAKSWLNNHQLFKRIFQYADLKRPEVLALAA